MIDLVLGRRKDTNFLNEHSLNIRGRYLDFDRCKVMAVVNLTPDSFYDGGSLSNQDDVLRKVEEHLNSGADMIDVGGYSSRPGAAEVSEDEERSRTIPMIKAIGDRFPEAILSIDTFRASIAVEAVQAGAAIINDISAGQSDREMLSTVGKLGVPYILMHMQGNPQTMQKNPQYDDVTGEVFQFFSERIDAARQAGINDLVIDPGFGFGKTVEHNYQLMRDLSQFALFNLPILVGVSRKSMINKVLKTNPEKALHGTTALHVLAVMNGANILRVHDVTPAKHAIDIGYQAQNT